MTEFDLKQAQLQALMHARNLDALLLQRVSSFAWATCGAASYVNTASTTGAGTLLILRGEPYTLKSASGEAARIPTRGAIYLLTNAIEAPRFEQEEGLAGQGWQFAVTPWHTPAGHLEHLTANLRLGSDFPTPGAVDISADLTRLRMNLQPAEVERFRALGTLSAAAMTAALEAARPGMTEMEIAALLEAETQARGAQPIVVLVATDERIFKFRHPLPTVKKMDKYAMLVLCARQKGLVASITRLVHFGKLTPELQAKSRATAAVDAAAIRATQPGRTLAQVFAEIQSAYAAAGYPDEWHLHHQGGPAGYEPREATANPQSGVEVAAGQVYAWNPSITGTKSEDSVLITTQGAEVLTPTPSLPVIEIDGFPRPAIWER
jgi:antitoxin VapB